MNNLEIEYLDITNENYDDLISKVITKCFETENLTNTKLYVSITLTTPEHIRRINNEFRNIDKETDVLSFPFYNKEEIIPENFTQFEDVLGDIVISIPRVKEQASEYGHSFERELAYMLVHGFYHIVGYDHIDENDKIVMREKEENILQQLNFIR